MFPALRGGNVKAGNVKVELKGKACQRCIDKYAIHRHTTRQNPAPTNVFVHADVDVSDKEICIAKM